MRFSLQYYLGGTSDVALEASSSFSFFAEATLSVEGGPLLIAGSEAFTPLVMSEEILTPLDIKTIDTIPLAVEE